MTPTDDYPDAADRASDEDETLEDPEGPQVCDLTDEESAETPTLPCPRCGEDVAELADRCPYCGEWIIPGGEQRAARRGWVFMIVAGLLVAALLYWLL